MSKNNLIFVGTIKKVINCGESMKNDIMLRRFGEVYDKVMVFNTWGAKTHPWRFFKLFYYMLFYPRAKIVVSATPYVAYDMIRFLDLLGKHNVYYWVIGGALAQWIHKKNCNVEYYKKLEGIFVESPKMAQELETLGIYGAVHVPNFKRIDYQPSIEERRYDKIKFVFLSRVHQEKGCSQIVESVKYLNGFGYKDRFSVDFFGPLDPEYPEFLSSIEGIDNVKYKGFLKIDNNGYDTLAQYNMMLFPTFWRNEGFPGVIIDAFISGLPVLASDWHFNSDLIDDTTGMIIPTNNQEALTNAMKKVIDGDVDLKALSENCFMKAMEYDVRSVLSVGQLKKLNVLI